MDTLGEIDAEGLKDGDCEAEGDKDALGDKLGL